MLTDFQNSFTIGLNRDSKMNCLLKFQTHLKRVATLPSETCVQN